MKHKIAIIVLVVLTTIGLFTSMYVVPEGEQAFITRFGDIPGLREPDGNQTELQKEQFREERKRFIKKSGLHFKVPFTDKVRRFEKRILEWDGRPSEVTTKDKRFIAIDTYARWRISEPIVFFRKLKDENYALSRLDDILNSATLNTVSRYNLVEVVRSKKRPGDSSDSNQTDGSELQLQEFNIGRKTISDSILTESKLKVRDYGIELLDFQFKRVNLGSQVKADIFKRMIAERKKFAAAFRSRGKGDADEIEGKMQRELDTINSEATRQEQEIKGKADADAAKIYTEAYAQSLESKEFYKFIKTMETYKTTLSQRDLLILSTKSEFFNYLKEIKPTP